MYVFAIVIGAATLVDTWDEHPPWLRVVAIVVGIAAIVSLRWRRTHPGAVGIGIGVVALVILTASGANIVATFNAAIRARGRDLAIIAGLAIAWAFVNPLLYPPAGSYWVRRRGQPADGGHGDRLGALRARAARARALAARSGRPRRGRGARGRAAADRARDARRARPPPLAALRPRGRARVPPRRAARGGRRSGRRDPRERAGRARGAARGHRRPARGRGREPDRAAAADASPTSPRWSRSRGRPGCGSPQRSTWATRRRPPPSAEPPTESRRRA